MNQRMTKTADGGRPRLRLPILLLLGLATAAPASAGEEVIVDGIPHIRNGTAPALGVARVELRELWRTGADENDQVFFGNVNEVLLGPDGNVYVMDSQLVQVYVFSSEGAYLRTLAGRGEGPGEVASLNDIFFLPDGRLGLGQAFPGKVVRLELNGDPAGSFDLGSATDGDTRFCVLVAGLARAEKTLIAGMRMSFQDPANVSQHLFLSRFDDQGAEGVCYISKDYPVNFADFVLDEAGISFVWSQFGIFPDGRVCFVPRRNRYEIHVCDADGTLERIITREYESLARNDARKRSARLTIEAAARSYNVPVQGVTIEDTEADIESLVILSDGTLCVRTSRGDRETSAGVLTTLDIFDPQGHFRQQRSLIAPGDAEKDAIYLLPDGLVAVVVGAVDANRREQGMVAEDLDEDEEARPLEVIVYRMD